MIKCSLENTCGLYSDPKIVVLTIVFGVFDYIPLRFAFLDLNLNLLLNLHWFPKHLAN